MALSTIDYTGISQLTGPIGSAANIPLTLQVNGGTTVVTADTSGNLYVGTTNQLATGFTNKLNVNGSIVGGSASATSGSVLLQNIYANGSTTNFGTEQSSGGPFIGCYVYPGSPAGTFLSSVNFGNTTSGSYVISGGNHKWYIGSTQNLATIGQTVTMTQALTLNTSGNLVFGTANAGIVFNNSSASVNSTLNDYETGTFSPYVSDGTTSVSLGTGQYVKIGKFVWVAIAGYNVNVSTLNAGTQLRITGLPFVNGVNVYANAIMAQNTPIVSGLSEGTLTTLYLWTVSNSVDYGYFTRNSWSGASNITFRFYYEYETTF